jgi:fructan beta-fructosidase
MRYLNCGIKGYLHRAGLMIFTSYIILSIAGCTRSSEKQSSLGADETHKEKFRPQYHFTPKEMWMNDPNGMVYFEGEYHLFYQHYPDSVVWGPMHWGHAVSKDLVHWEHLPIALYPDSLGYIFSGSAVIDWNNTSGFGSKDNPPMVAIFTHRHLNGKPRGFESQSVAFSVDKGRSWTKYKNNPVLVDENSLGFRDPKVFWHSNTQKWIMILSAEDRVRLFSSANLIDWKPESSFGENIGAHGGVWECPDLFELPVEGTQETKWVMLVSIGNGGPNGGSATQYFIGDFDGTHFTPVNEDTNWLDYGKDNYAGVTWSDLPDKSRRVFLGWMSNWQYANVVPTHPWRSAMTIPRDLYLKCTEDTYRLVSLPVPELIDLRNNVEVVSSQVISTNLDLNLKNNQLCQSEYIFEFENATDNETLKADSIIVEWSNVEGERLEVGYLLKKNVVFINRTVSGLTDFSNEFPVKQTAPYSSDRSLKLHVFMDWSSTEVFVNDGEVVMTSLFFPDKPYEDVRIYSKGGEITLKEAKIWELNSVWNEDKRLAD